MGFLASCSNTTEWMHHMDANKRHGKKKLNENYTRMLPEVLNESGKKHPTIKQLYGHLSPISQIIQVRQIRYTGHSR